MTFLIDTNIEIHARDGTPSVLARLEAHDGSVLLSALCLAELQRGPQGDPTTSALRRERLTFLLMAVSIVPFDEAAAAEYGRIIGACGWVRGRDFDRMIAAHALSLGATLVTNNVSDFRDVPDLVIEDWVEPTRA